MLRLVRLDDESLMRLSCHVMKGVLFVVYPTTALEAAL